MADGGAAGTLGGSVEACQSQVGPAGVFAWGWLAGESESVLSGSDSVVELADVVEVAAVYEADVELRCAEAGNPLDSDGVGGTHVDLHIPVVLVPRLVCEAQVCLAELDVLEG